MHRIIVGVKYCFRYNARNRARLNGQHEDVDMQGLARPHRRRREKKLMTIDEVNEKFPATKYKTWRATREVLGLPTTGGITAPDEPLSIPTARQSMQAERQQAMTEVTNTVPVVDTVPTVPVAAHLPPPTTSTEENDHTNPSTVSATTTQFDPSSTQPQQIEREIEPEEDEEAVAAVPADLAATSGDACAICIDNLEDIDDIRGLTCGHAFHTGCLDPWLTTRRACCPLCKHDYYVPKPRSEAEIEADAAARDRRRLAHEQMTSGSGGAWTYRLQTFVLPVFGLQPNRQRRRQPAPRRAPLTTHHDENVAWIYNIGLEGHRRPSANQNTRQEGSRGGLFSSVASRFSRQNRANQNQAATPSQMEAGLATAPSAAPVTTPSTAHVV